MLDLYQITQQGDARINSACENSCKVRLLTIDLKTKYCEVEYTGNTPDNIPVIGIGVSERTPIYDDASIDTIADALEEAESTELIFPDLKGYRIHSTNISRYTLSICFVEEVQ